MQVYIVDTTLSVRPVGRMEAVVGMTTSVGNKIAQINGDSCLIESPNGNKRKCTEVCIDISEALKHGLDVKRDVAAPPKAATKRAPAKRAEKPTPMKGQTSDANKSSKKQGRARK